MRVTSPSPKKPVKTPKMQVTSPKKSVTSPKMRVTSKKNKEINLEDNRLYKIKYPGPGLYEAILEISQIPGGNLVSFNKDNMNSIMKYWKWLYDNNPHNFPKVVNFINNDSNYIKLHINNSNSLQYLLDIVKAINSPTSRAWGRDDITVIVNKKTGLIDLNKTITLDNINWDYYDDVELFGKIIKLIKIN